MLKAEQIASSGTIDIEKYLFFEEANVVYLEGSLSPNDLDCVALPLLGSSFRSLVGETEEKQEDEMVEHLLMGRITFEEYIRLKIEHKEMFPSEKEGQIYVDGKFVERSNRKDTDLNREVVIVDYLEGNINRKGYLEKKNSPECRRNFEVSDFAPFFGRRKNN